MDENISKEEQAQQRRDELNDICAVMDTGAGRRFVWRLLEKAHIFASPYVGQTNDTMFSLGEHNMGIFIFSEITEANFESYLQMQSEQKKDIADD